MEEHPSFAVGFYNLKLSTTHVDLIVHMSRIQAVKDFRCCNLQEQSNSLCFKHVVHQ